MDAIDLLYHWNIGHNFVILADYFFEVWTTHVSKVKRRQSVKLNDMLIRNGLKTSLLDRWVLVTTRQEAGWLR
ncbi:hypothetical protein HUJ05_003156 [Dendroctonus ponderosae]|nr:hypothetical protein HUJ05_003156 [Dendroctonus ponderosae]